MWKSSLALKGFWALTGEQWIKKGESAFGQVFTSKTGNESLDFPGKRGAKNHTIPRDPCILAAWVGGAEGGGGEEEEEVHEKKTNEKLGKMLFTLSSD